MKKTNLIPVKLNINRFILAIVLIFGSSLITYAQNKFSVNGYKMGMTETEVRRYTTNATSAKLLDEKSNDWILYSYSDVDRSVILSKSTRFSFTNSMLTKIEYSTTYVKKGKNIINDYNNKKIEMNIQYGKPIEEYPSWDKKTLPNLYWLRDSFEIRLSEAYGGDVNLDYTDMHNIKTIANYGKTTIISQKNEQINATVLKPSFGNLTIYTTFSDVYDINIQIVPYLNEAANRAGTGHFALLNGLKYDTHGCLPINDLYDGTNGNNNIAIAPNEQGGIKGLAVGPFAGRNWNNSQSKLNSDNYLSINLPYGEYVITCTKKGASKVIKQMHDIIDKDCSVIELNND